MSTWLKTQRKKLGIKQLDVATALGISRPTYAAIELDPDRLTIRQIPALEKLGIHMDYSIYRAVDCPSCNGTGTLYRLEESTGEMEAL